MKTIVCHSGGMDSSICLALAIREHGAERVYALTYSFGQRHALELHPAARICADWGIKHKLLDLPMLREITISALLDDSLEIHHPAGKPANTMVVGRNGLFAHLAAIYADHVGASSIYLGVLGLEAQNSGYRDCSRAYMGLKERILHIELGDDQFRIYTPLVEMTKAQTMKLAQELGVLDYLLQNTISCYRGQAGKGCGACPACLLRAQGLREFSEE